AALRAITRAGVIHQDAPHQLSRDRKEVRAALPLNVARVNQSQVCLIDQRRGLQRYAVSFAPALLSHVALRQPAQLFVYQVDQLIEGCAVAVAPGDEPLSDFL